MTPLHICIFGPRDLHITTADVAARFDRLPAEKLPNPRDIVIWDGAASGVDAAGHAFAIERGYSFERRPYLSEHGKAGGPIRNRNVANELAALVAIGHRAIGFGWRWAAFLTPGTGAWRVSSRAWACRFGWSKWRGAVPDRGLYLMGRVDLLSTNKSRRARIGHRVAVTRPTRSQP